MNEKKIAIGLTIFALLLALAIPSFVIPASGQAQQVTATVNLNYLTVQVTYPSEVAPGDSITAHVQATAKSTFYLSSLVAQVFYADGSSIRQLSTTNIATDKSLASGNVVSGDIQLSIPQDAPRTSLVAAFTENARVTNSYANSYYTYSYPYAYTYYYYPYMYYYGNYSYPYYYYCYGYGCSYPVAYYKSYYTYSYYSYPSYSYSTTTDVGITSMPYIKATTPEAQQLQQQLSQAQADNQKLQAENQQLKQNLQNSQQTISQQSQTIQSMNQSASTNKYLTYGLGGLAAIFAILAGIFRRGRGKVAAPAPPAHA